MNKGIFPSPRWFCLTEFLLNKSVFIEFFPIPLFILQQTKLEENREREIFPWIYFPPNLYFLTLF